MCISNWANEDTRQLGKHWKGTVRTSSMSCWAQGFCRWSTAVRSIIILDPLNKEELAKMVKLDLWFFSSMSGLWFNSGLTKDMITIVASTELFLGATPCEGKLIPNSAYRDLVCSWELSADKDKSTSWSSLYLQLILWLIIHKTKLFHCAKSGILSLQSNTTYKMYLSSKKASLDHLWSS